MLTTSCGDGAEGVVCVPRSRYQVAPTPFVHSFTERYTEPFLAVSLEMTSGSFLCCTTPPGGRAPGEEPKGGWLPTMELGAAAAPVVRGTLVKLPRSGGIAII